MLNLFLFCTNISKLLDLLYYFSVLTGIQNANRVFSPNLFNLLSLNLQIIKEDIK